MAIDRKAVHTCQIGTSLQTTTIPLSSLMEATTLPATLLLIDLWTEVVEVADPLDILSLMQVWAGRV